MAASPTLHLPEDTLDDILYFARTNSLSDLKELLAENAAIQRTTPLAILTAAVDPYSGNDALHMASANGHTDMIGYILSLLLSSATSSNSTPSLLLNTTNTAGNTPLHYACLNGHLAATKLLLSAGADATIVNRAGHDAVYEAEVGGHDSVASIVLEMGIGLERGIGGVPVTEDAGTAQNGMQPKLEDGGDVALEEEDLDSGVTKGMQTLDVDGRP